MQRKEKTCKHCHLQKIIFSKGLCATCDKIVNPNKYAIKRSELKRTSTIIPKVSDIQKRRIKQYKTLRNEYILQHPICECCNQQKSIEIHHKAGREGENLFQHFLAVCHGCHVKIEMNPEWAKENGYSISRIA